jgi:hypothetical protein
MSIYLITLVQQKFKKSKRLILYCRRLHGIMVASLIRKLKDRGSNLRATDISDLTC